MKKLLLLSILCWAGLSCTKKDELPEPAIYTIRLHPAGEVAPFVQPGNEDDLYGVQIYSRSRLTGGDYTPYAYAIVTDTGMLQIELSNQYEYKFEFGVNRKYNSNDLGHFIMATYDGNSWSATIAPLEDMGKPFAVTSSKYLSDLKLGFLPPYIRVPVDRYYGELTDYIPSKNDKVAIETKRAVFGAKFIAHGLTSGELTVTLIGTTSISLTPFTLELSSIYTFEDLRNCWLNPSAYTETVTLWVVKNESSTPLINAPITFKRNVLTTVTIDAQTGAFTTKEEPLPWEGI